MKTSLQETSECAMKWVNGELHVTIGDLDTSIVSGHNVKVRW